MSRAAIGVWLTFRVIAHTDARARFVVIDRCMSIDSHSGFSLSSIRRRLDRCSQYTPCRDVQRRAAAALRLAEQEALAVDGHKEEVSLRRVQGVAPQVVF